MTKNYYEMHGHQKTPHDYKTGRNSGTIFHTMWNSLNQVGVKKAKEACAKNCRGAWSVGKFPQYPTVTFRFFDDDDIQWWSSYLLKIDHTI